MKLKKRIKYVFTVFAVISCSVAGMAQEGHTDKDRMDEMWGESNVTIDVRKDGRAKLFDEGNFGMFMHWGLFSHLGGQWNGKTYYGIGEWIMRVAGIPVNEYKAIAEEFDPKSFSAKEIAKLAKDAGMKYIIVNSKHHDGFAMFQTKADAFNIVDATPFARDPMKELAEACREAGLGFGFYYSHNQDWTTPGGTGGPAQYDEGTPASFNDYFYKKSLPQVKELCSNYGQIDFIWFDTPANMKKELIEELVRVVRSLQPKAMLCSRVGYGMGDYISMGDMEIPLRNTDGLWETADTNNDSWSYVWYDKNFKTPKEILQRLISTVARGGTYLLNIGPDGDGKVPEMGAQFLRDVGRWIQKYPQVIYGAGSSPWGHALPWGDVTTNGNSLFLSIFEWPQDGKLFLPGLKSKIISANLLEGEMGKEVSFNQKNGLTILSVPFKPADSPASVIELKLDKNAGTASVNNALCIYPNIATRLFVEFADVVEVEKQSIRWMEKFGEWKKVCQVSNWKNNGKVMWTVNVLQPGYYRLELRYKGQDRLVWSTLTDEGIKVQNQQPATTKYQQYPMGIMEFKEAGKHTITVSLEEGDPETSSLESLLIYPTK